MVKPWIRTTNQTATGNLSKTNGNESSIRIRGTNLKPRADGVAVKSVNHTLEVTEFKPNGNGTSLKIKVKTIRYNDEFRPDDLEEITVTVTNSSTEEDEEAVDVEFE
ncbi:MAG: hypothetical protein QGG71_23895 [Pirellulaceae bacterium]|jgi:hypothetical protein|nr:hypothetical protein [Pirellulaceae bacterium]